MEMREQGKGSLRMNFRIQKSIFVVCMGMWVLAVPMFRTEARDQMKIHAQEQVKITNKTGKVLVLKKGKSYQVKTNKKKNITWKTSNKKIVSVSANGKLKAKKTGTAVLTVSAPGCRNVKWKIKVGEPVKRLHSYRKTYVTYVGRNLTLKPSIQPKTASWRQLSYEVKNKKIASISKKGVLKGKKTGTTTVTIRTTDESRKTERITVKILKSKKAVRLADDFFQNVNGETFCEVQLDENNPNWSVFQDIQTKVDQRSEEIVKEAEQNAAINEDGSPADNIAALSLTGKDEAGRNARKASELQDYFSRIDGAGNIAEFLQVEGQLRREGIEGVIPLAVNVSLDDYKTYCLYVNTQNVVLDYSTYENPKCAGVQNSYKAFLKQSLLLAGEEDGVAAQKAEQVYALQKSMAPNTAKALKGLKNSMSEQEQEAYLRERMYLHYTKGELNQAFATCDLNNYLDAAGYGQLDDFVVVLPENITQIAGQLVEEQLGTWKAWAKCAIIYQFATSLDQETYDAYKNLCYSQGEAMFATMTDYSDDYVAREMQWDISKLYTDRYVSLEQKQAVANMVEQIVGKYYEQMAQCGWMTDATKQGALQKITTLTKNIAFPEDYTPYLVHSNFTTPEQGGTLVGNLKLLYAEKEEARRRIVGTVLSGSDWIAAPLTVNAWYYSYNNSITISAALLNDQIYSGERSCIANLGSLGTIIGHEITHAFDQTGSAFDYKGDKLDWWTTEDKKKFLEIQNQVEEYYNSYEVIEGKGVFSNGKQTLSENIADLAGIHCALGLVEDSVEAYQEFFRSYAQLWAEKMTEDAQKYYAVYDVHSSGKIRVNAVLPMQDAFYMAFGIKKGDAMYVNKADRIQIWK